MSPPCRGISLAALDALSDIADHLSIISTLTDPTATLGDKDRADLALLLGALARQQQAAVECVMGARDEPLPTA